MIWETFATDSRLIGLCLAMGTALLLFAIVGGVLRSSGLFLALAWGASGMGLIVALSLKCSGKSVALLSGISAVASGAFYVCLEIRKRGIERKRRRAEKARRKEFTLPDRDNSYVRERLRTALDPERTEAAFDSKTLGVRLGYIRKLLAGVKGAPLTPVERLDVEELAAFIAACAYKESWSSGELKGLNEAFARLLKMSAKYEIAV